MPNLVSARMWLNIKNNKKTSPVGGTFFYMYNQLFIYTGQEVANGCAGFRGHAAVVLANRFAAGIANKDIG